MFIIFIFYFSHFNKERKSSKSTNQTINELYEYSNLGFYQISIRNGDILRVYLNSGKQNLFFFIPFDPNFYIRNISIDGVPVRSHLLPRGLSIEGNDNVTLTFYSTNNNMQLQANFWIIPSTICPKYSAYVYGTNSIEVHSDVSQLCIFSPTFDSKNTKFKIESGIPFFTGYHYSLIYTTDFHNPTYVNDGNKIESHTIKTANFVSFFTSNSNHSKLNDTNEYFTFSYKRRTKAKDVSYSQNYCFADSVYKCSSKECSFTSVFVFTDCLDYNIETIVIVGSIVGFVFAVTMLVLISCFFVKKKKNIDQNDALSTVPLNNENEYLNGSEKDYTSEKSNQQYLNYFGQNDYSNPYDPSTQINYPNQTFYQNFSS